MQVRMYRCLNHICPELFFGIWNKFQRNVLTHFEFKIFDMKQTIIQ